MERKISTNPQSGLKEDNKGRLRFIIIVSVFVIVVLIIIAIPYYQNYVYPFKRTIIKVDDQNISMRSFLERTRLTNSDPMSMLQLLTNELLIKIAAPKYGIQISDDDVEKKLRSLASSGGGNISDVEFREWYRQQLNTSRLSDSQYRKILRTNLLINNFHAYLAERVPTETEHVHLHIIVIKTYEDAQKVVQRLKAGEDFSEVARDVSIERESKDKGGDLGWMPLSVCTFKEQIALLDINQVSDPIPRYNKPRSPAPNISTAPDAFYLIKVSGKEESRTVSDLYMNMLRENALETWLQEEIQKHDVKYNFNSEIYAWINWQLQKK